MVVASAPHVEEEEQLEGADEGTWEDDDVPSERGEPELEEHALTEEDDPDPASMSFEEYHKTAERRGEPEGESATKEEQAGKKQGP